MSSDFQRLGEDALQLALRTASQLERELGAEGGDTKRAKELSGILKDVTGLARELCGREAKEITVRFLGETQEAGE